jgi:hypothetical protein
LLFLVFNSCRKIEVASIAVSNQNNIESFFNLPPDVSPEIIRISDRLKQLNLRTGFIGQMIEKEGFAVWDKTISKTNVSLPSIQPISMSTNAIRTNATNNKVDTIIYIPLVLKNTKNVNSFIYAKLNGSISLRLYRGREYEKQGFEDFDKNENSAEHLALQIMLLDQKVFGYTSFGLKDDRLFKGKVNLNASKDTIKERKLSFKNSSIYQNDSTKVNRIVDVITEWCVTERVWSCRNNLPFSGEGCCDHDPNLCYRTTRDCYETVKTYFVESNYDDPPPTGGGDGNTVGGGGGNNAPIYIPSSGPKECNPTPIIDNGLLPCEEGNTTGWTVADVNGFLYTRIDELKSYLLRNKFVLLPCDSLNDLNTYGPMYQRIAQFQVPQPILDRIDSIKLVAPSSIFADFNVQKLNDANGSVVNCDFFPIRITLLPNGFTAKSLIEHFRKKINNFIDADVNVQFSPYIDQNFLDTARFNASYEKSLGSLVHIKMLNDGSVIQSEYYQDSTVGYEKYRFKYSTITTPLDYRHPVSGNREFGIYSDTAHPGEYVFYTMGVDRTSDIIFSIGNAEVFGRPGFTKADNTWSTIQKNMIQFIIDNGGQSEKYKQIKARPKWEDVKDYLLGNCDFAELKRRLGC